MEKPLFESTIGSQPSMYSIIGCCFTSATLKLDKSGIAESTKYTWPAIPLLSSFEGDSWGDRLAEVRPREPVEKQPENNPKIVTTRHRIRCLYDWR